MNTPFPTASSGLIRRLSSACALFALFAAAAFAQNTGSISGVVTDRVTSGFLVGADVRVAGTDLATATARDGTFSLSNVPPGPQSIEVTYVGRKPKTIPVNVRPGTVSTTTIDLARATYSCWKP